MSDLAEDFQRHVEMTKEIAMILGGLGYDLVTITHLDEFGKYFQLFAEPKGGGARIPLYNTGYTLDQIKQFITDRCPPAY